MSVWTGLEQRAFCSQSCKVSSSLFNNNIFSPQSTFFALSALFHCGVFHLPGGGLTKAYNFHLQKQYCLKRNLVCSTTVIVIYHLEWNNSKNNLQLKIGVVKQQTHQGCRKSSTGLRKKFLCADRKKSIFSFHIFQLPCKSKFACEFHRSLYYLELMNAKNWISWWNSQLYIPHIN